MQGKSAKKGRYNFLINSSVYRDFSLICEELGLIRSKKLEHSMNEFIKKNKALLQRIKNG